MKKILGLIAIAFIVVLALVTFKLDALIKAGVETAGPQVLKADVTLDSVRLSLLSGGLRLNGLAIGNPQGYKTKTAFSLSDVRVTVAPASVTKETIVVKEVIVRRPEITIEGGLKSNNLTQLQRNAEEYAPASKPAKGQAGSSKKVVIEHVRVEGAKVRLKLDMLAGQDVVIPMPDLELRDIGKSSGGVSPAKAAGEILGSITASALKAAAGAPGLVKNLTKSVVEQSNKLLNLFKKK